MLVFLRRRALGHATTIGLERELQEMGHEVDRLRHDRSLSYGGRCREQLTRCVLWRHGVNANSFISDLSKTVNPTRAIQQVNDKLSFVKRLRESLLSPDLITSDGVVAITENLPPSTQFVVRPRHHAQGRNLTLATLTEVQTGTLSSRPDLSNGWYARRLVNKVKEYRVYVLKGRVAAVAEKVPNDPSAIAWNTARGGSVFYNRRWGNWPLAGCAVAVKAMALTELDYGGVDIMEDDEGNFWVIEINSAPSLPLSEDGTTTYRHKSVAKAIAYHLDNGWDALDCDTNSVNNWRDVIHPGLWVPRSESAAA